ncbi:MAG: hypothetical protein ACTSVV_08075 [Promethearchaeota archaeon]
MDIEYLMFIAIMYISTILIITSLKIIKYEVNLNQIIKIIANKYNLNEKEIYKTIDLKLKELNQKHDKNKNAK